MTFNSWEFLIFYPVVLLLYFLLPKKLKAVALLILSYYFYMFYQAELILLILFTTLVSYFSAMVIGRSENAGLKKLMLATSLIVCLGALFLFKYFNFLFSSVVSVVELFGGECPSIVLNLVLPVGISFYTFQTLSYVIDVYRGRIEYERSFLYYALFVSFFPQLVAGPIERPENLLPQLKEEHKWDKENAVIGARTMLLGFFKKVAVADILAVYVNAVYNDIERATGFGVLLATLLFCVQIYCDFSGYTDIAIGCARVMGIRLSKNFDKPYTSTTIKEFWSRWHISLSSWFRDYLYFPLGGSRCSKARHLFNLFVVFLVSGLWHGAKWTFVLWGVLHAVYQIVGVLTIDYRNKLIKKLGCSTTSLGVRVVRCVITFMLVAFAFLFFRANSIDEAILLLTKLFSDTTPIPQSLSAMGIELIDLALIVLPITLLILLESLSDYEKPTQVLTKNCGFVYVLWLLILSFGLLLSMDMESSFIYFQF